MIKRNVLVIPGLLVLIIIVVLASFVPPSDLSFAQNSDSFSDMIVQPGDRF